MKTKVIVTGGAGFIGSHVVDACVLRGWETHIIDNLSAGKKENINAGAIFHHKDIRNMNDIAPFFKGVSYVFHLAALPRVQYSIKNPQETNDVNVCGTLNILTVSKANRVKRVIYSASSSAYGNQKKMPLVESMPVDPLSPYGLQKYIGEQYAKVFSGVYGLETVSLRYFNVYGPRFDPNGAYALVIGKFLKQKKERTPITITGDGKQTRDFTHVSDVVRANMLAAECKKVGRGEVINIGAGRNISIRNIADMIGGEIDFIPARLEPHDTLADNTRARKVLGWEPKVGIEDGLGALL